MKYTANIITSIRIIFSIIMLFLSIFSPEFYIAYLICGFTDMIDGPIARKTKSASSFGSALDSIADFLFTAAAFAKLFPILDLPLWLWCWISLIAVAKIINLLFGYISKRKLIFVHSAMNKVLGFLLFLLPLTVSFIELKYSATVLCVIASFSAVQENHYIKSEIQTA